jgi:ADP-heptose:LPS heptosyltransferase
MKIAILREDRLGDMIMTTPLARALAGADHDVTVVGPQELAPVWDNNPFARYVGLQTICGAWPRGLVRLSNWLRAQQPAALFIPHHSRRLFTASLLSGITQRYCQMGRIAGRLTFHRCLRTRLDTNPRHVVEALLDFPAHLGIPRKSLRPELFLSEEERPRARDLLRMHLPGNAPLVVVHPFSRGSSCNLRLEEYAAIVRALRQTTACRIVVTGTGSEADQWVRVAKGLTAGGVWNACGKLTLRQLFAVIANARVIIVASTGPLHVASALGIPSVSPFCPHPWVGPKLWGSFAAGSVALLAPIHSCPRYRRRNAGNCGFPEGPRAADIVEAVLNLIEANGTRCACGSE